MNLKHDAAITVDADDYFTEIQPNGGFMAGNTFTANSYADFNINKSSLDKVNRCTLKMVLTNSSGTAITLLPGNLLLDHYYLQIGNQIVDTVFGWNSFIDCTTVLTDDVTSQYIGAVAGYDGVTFSSTVTVPAMGNTQLFIPLPTPLDTIRPTIAAWPAAATILLRLFFMSGTSIFTGSQQTGLAVSGLALRIHGQQMSAEDIRREQSSMLSNGELSYRFLQHRAGNATPGTWNANTPERMPMTAVNGDIAYMHFTVRPLNPQGTQVITPVQITSYQIETNASINILGINQLEDSYARNVLSPEKMPRTFFYQKTYTYLVSWTPNCRLVYKQGARIGGNDTFAGGHFLNIVPQTSGTFVVDFMAMAYTFLHIKANGEVIVETMLNAS